jgi:hypothetical protein
MEPKGSLLCSKYLATGPTLNQLYPFHPTRLPPMEDELPVVNELCPLPTLSNKMASSRSQKAAVVT